MEILNLMNITYIIGDLYENFTTNIVYIFNNRYPKSSDCLFLSLLILSGYIYIKISNMEFVIKICDNMRIAREKKAKEETKYKTEFIKEKWACQSHQMYNMDCGYCVGRYECYKVGHRTKRVRDYETECIIL